VDAPPQIDARIDIDACIERVWQVLTDFERYPDWNPFTVRVDARLEIGAPVRMRVNLIRSFVQPQTEYITTHDEGRRVCWSMKGLPSWLIGATRCQWLEPLSGGRTRYASTDRITGILAPIVLIFFGGPMQDGFERAARALKRRAEEV